jgi:mannosyltransferase OCH1-like enzyme
MIPKIIHQIWWQGEDNIPKTYPNHTTSWKTINKDYKYYFWDEQKIKKLLKSYPKNIQKRFNEYPRMIQKIDMAKFIILHTYGGLYVDIDSECIKPINDLLKNKKIVLIEMNISGLEKLFSFGYLNGLALQNGVMAGQKNHYFWIHCLNSLVNEDITQRIYEPHFRYILRTVGPALLTEAYKKYPNKKQITIISHNLVDPVSWCNYETLNCANKSCKQYYPNAYTIHHYGSKSSTNNWTDNLEQKVGFVFCKYRQEIHIIVILIFLIIIYFIVAR